MVSKDRSKTDSAASETREKKRAGSKASAKTTRERQAPPAGKPQEAQPTTASSTVEADRKPPHPGIDAMDILGEAETEERADAAQPGEPEVPVSAAEVITKATARDHPDTGAAPRPQELGAPRAEPKPRLAPKTPFPAEPKEPIAGVGAEGLPPPLADEEEVAAILNAEHTDPFSFLGMHQGEPNGAPTVRAFLPGVDGVKVVDAGSDEVVAELKTAHDEGLFVGEMPGRRQPFPYRLRITTAQGEADIDDPYRFPPVLSDSNMKQLATGEDLTSYQVLGAHPAEVEGVKGTTFAVWAPNASHVSVVGGFNDWDGRRHGMRLRDECGVWEIFLPGVSSGALYKYEIKGAAGAASELKSDPYACLAERPPGSASVVHEAKRFRWRDESWINSRKKHQSADAPLSFYEVHLGSWRRKPEQGNRHLTYRETAEELVEYVSDLGFTHIAVLPISEHSYDETLGYLPSALYAPTSRFGTPDDLRYLVDACHDAGIGVVADWVPNYLSQEPHGLARFDGTTLYEHPDPRQRRDPDWNTPMFNFSSPQVTSYLLGNALYWCDRFHLDGLRIDGLAKMLYLDYGRGEGEWTPNKDGGNEDLEALAFVSRLNELVATRHPGAMTIAEDSSLRQGVTKPIEDGGLGFGYRWNTAWAYKTLRYLSRHPVHRKYYQFELTDPLAYAFDENFVLPVSHDHVSFGQGSITDKIPGDRWQKLATLRAWYALMYALPGKKLMFMGTEFAQSREWNSDLSLDWHLLEDPMHLAVQRLVRVLNKLYREQPALHELDADSKGFEWLDFSDEDNSVVAFSRYGKDRKKAMVVVTHFTPVVRPNYRIGVPKRGRYKEVLNTDAAAYGGRNTASEATTAESHPAHGQEYSLTLTLPPYATVMLELAE
jgi:1,4-alpha-glucan branching enzyme